MEHDHEWPRTFVSMSVRKAHSSWTLGGLLWGIALLALASGSVVSPPNRSGVVGLTMLGHGLVLLAIAIEIFRGKDAKPPDDAWLVGGVLAVFLLIELTASLIARHEHDVDQCLWFASALGFSAAGILACRHGGASDGAIAVQLLFQGLMIVPAIGSFLISGFYLLGNPQADSRTTSFSAGFFIIVSVVLPIAFVASLAALAHDHARQDAQPSRVWTVLLIHEAAYVILAARWCYNGF